MEKRYQVFVSSTFADLKDERQAVIQALMEMDCIPAGMELFPAADEEQFNFIKKIIDDCDYYVLIIGGRYGSVGSDGVSYTQKEYEYAIEQGLKVLAFVHKSPGDIPSSKTESTPELREKLQAFREEVSTGRLVKFWESAKELPGLVALSLAKTIKTYPAVGWVRANQVSNDDLLNDLNELRKENDSLRAVVSELRKNIPSIPQDLAPLDDEHSFHICWSLKDRSGKKTKLVKASWREIFGYIGSKLEQNPHDASVSHTLAEAMYQKCREPSSYGDNSVIYDAPYSLRVVDKDWDTIRLQLKTTGLVNVVYGRATNGSMALFWSLSKPGQALLVSILAVRKQST